MKVWNVVSALNDRYVPYTYVMLYSLFKNNPAAHIRVYLLESDVSDSSMERLDALAGRYDNEINYIKMDDSMFDERLLDAGDWSMETCYRLAMNDVLPKDLDRVIYLDGDMIINADISDLYEMRFERDRHLVVTHDMTMTPDSGEVYGELHTEVFNKLIRENSYFNAGMILMDMEYLRSRYGLADYMRMAESLNYEVFAPDQDLLNLMHKDETQYVDAWEYDLFACNAFIRGYDLDRVRRDVKIIHFVGDKPWQGGSHFHYDVEHLWWDYALETVYAEELLTGFISSHFGESAFYGAIRKAEEFNSNLRNNLTEAITTFNKWYSTVSGQAVADCVKLPEPKKLDIPIYKQLPSETLSQKDNLVRRIIDDVTVKEYVDYLRRENKELQAQLEEALNALDKLRQSIQK